MCEWDATDGDPGQSFLLSYNLLVLMGGPTFFNKKIKILYTYINGASTIRVMTIRKKISVGTGSFTPPLNILWGWIDKHRKFKTVYGTSIVASNDREQCKRFRIHTKIDCLPNHFPWGSFSKKIEKKRQKKALTLADLPSLR